MDKFKKQLIGIWIIFIFFIFTFPVMAAEFPRPLGEDSLQIIIGRVINVVLGVVGSVFLVMFIYGGVLWMMSSGNNEKIQKGRDTLIWATLGLIVIFASYAMVRFVLVGLRQY